MVTSKELLKILPAATLKKKKVADRQSVPLIIELVLEAHKKYSSHYDLISKKFWRGSAKKTVQYLFDFCKAEMTYLAESAKQQTVRSPAAILETRRAWGVDCKHYAGFIGGILDSLRRSGKNIEWCYMFVSYDPSDSTPEHVFISAVIDGKVCYIDPVLTALDCRFPKFHYFQQKFPCMSLYTVNGTRRRVGAIDQVRAENLSEYGYSSGGGGGSMVKPPSQIVDYVAPSYIAPDIKITTMQPENTGGPAVVQTMQPTGNSSASSSSSSSQVGEKKFNWLLWLLIAGGVYYLSKKSK